MARFSAFGPSLILWAVAAVAHGQMAPAGQAAYLSTALDRWSIDLPIAVTMAEDPSPQVRERAVRVLASTVDPTAIPLLKVYLADSNPTVRRQVMLAAGRLGPAGLELAAGGLGDPSPLVRQAAAWAVCHGGDGGWKC